MNAIQVCSVPRIYTNICRTRANTRAVYLLISRQVLIIQIPKNIFSQMLQARIGNEFFKIAGSKWGAGAEKALNSWAWLFAKKNTMCLTLLCANI